MKKYLSVILCILICVFNVSCSQSDDNKSGSDKTIGDYIGDIGGAVKDKAGEIVDDIGEMRSLDKPDKFELNGVTYSLDNMLYSVANLLCDINEEEYTLYSKDLQFAFGYNNAKEIIYVKSKSKKDQFYKNIKCGMTLEEIEDLYDKYIDIVEENHLIGDNYYWLFDKDGNNVDDGDSSACYGIGITIKDNVSTEITLYNLSKIAN